MNRPKLSRAPSSSPFGRAINQLNRAVSDQANIKAGDGLGISVGPAGRSISINSPILMDAKSTGDGVPAAEDLDDGGRKFGVGKVYVAFTKLVDGDYVTYPDTDSLIEVLNKSSTEVDANNWLVIAKVGNVWQVIWEDCKPPDDGGGDEGGA